jgi:hypothetical protein
MIRPAPGDIAYKKSLHFLLLVLDVFGQISIYFPTHNAIVIAYYANMKGRLYGTLGYFCRSITATSS